MKPLAWPLLLALAGAAAADDGPAPAIDRHDIRVWTVPQQPLHGFRAVTRVRSSLAGLVGLLLDTGAAPQWVYRTRRLELLRRDDGLQTFTVRAETDFWPLQDRDVVVDGRITQDPHTLIVSIDSHSAPAAQFPPQKGFVRMPHLEGHWQFRPLGGGLVEVTMSGHADPGGHIPGFLVNLVVQETPYRTLLGLRRLIGAPRYQQLRLDGIREPEAAPATLALARPAP